MDFARRPRLAHQAEANQFRPRRWINHPAFTLVELLVAMTVFLVLMVMVFQVVSGTTSIWTNSAGKVTAFSDARGAFEAVTRTISQATLNPYVDYVGTDGNFRNPATAASFTPASYGRRSDLHFICGKALLTASAGGSGSTQPAVPNPVGHSVFFQAPLGYYNQTANPTYQGMQNLLNACGFYVFYGPDPAKPSLLPSTVPNSYRFRLMQFVQPAENLSIYDTSNTQGLANWDGETWFFNPVQADMTAAAAGNAMVATSEMAQNVVALVILPEYSQADQTPGKPLSTNYEYDSRNNTQSGSSPSPNFNQLPPAVQVVMFVIDERSAVLLGNSQTPPNLGVGNLFQLSANLSADITTLENNLSAIPGNLAGNTLKLNFEVFQSKVALPGSKWSTN